MPWRTSWTPKELLIWLLFPATAIALSVLVTADDHQDMKARQNIEAKSPAWSQELLNLPYMGTSPKRTTRARRSVRTYDQVQPGYNLYCSRTAKEALLIDMAGETVWGWKLDTKETWQGVKLEADGSLYVILKDHELLKLDRHSNVIWRHQARAHHDFDTAGNSLYMLTRRDVVIPELHEKNPILEDLITVLDRRTGEEIRTVSLLEVFRVSSYAYLLPDLANQRIERNRSLDILHTNSVQVLDRNHGGPFLAGDLLVCSRNINSVYLVDSHKQEIKWLYGPSNLTLPHHPTILQSKVYIFDNGTEASRIVELDPFTMKITWTYQADGFFSQTRGSVQPLENGHFLVTESNTGRVFEINPGGDTVWEFRNPETRNGKRSVIWRMIRYYPQDLQFLN